MANVTVLAMGTYTAQTFVIGPIAIPDNVLQIGARFWRETSADTSLWNNPLAKISSDFNISVNGAPYADWFNTGPDGGGIATGKAGEIPFTDFMFDVPPGINRSLLGSVVFSDTIKTQCDVTVI